MALWIRGLLSQGLRRPLLTGGSLDRRPSKSAGLYGQEAISRQEALSVRRPLWSGSPLSQVSLDKGISQLGGLPGHEALSVRRPLWTGGPCSQEVSLDGKPSLDKRPLQSGGLSGREALSSRRPLDRRPSVSRMPPKSGGLSGQEAHSVRALLWTGSRLSQQTSLDRRPS